MPLPLELPPHLGDSGAESVHNQRTVIRSWRLVGVNLLMRLCSSGLLKPDLIFLVPIFSGLTRNGGMVKLSSSISVRHCKTFRSYEVRVGKIIGPWHVAYWRVC